MKPRPPNGFTLVETLLTVAVLAVGLTAVTGMVVAASNASRAAREVRRMDSFATAVFTGLALEHMLDPNGTPVTSELRLPTPAGSRPLVRNAEDPMLFPGEDLWELAPQFWYRLEVREAGENENRLIVTLELSSRDRSTQQTYHREITRHRRAW